jgi:hypothetical protein
VTSKYQLLHDHNCRWFFYFLFAPFIIEFHLSEMAEFQQKLAYFLNYP